MKRKKGKDMKRKNRILTVLLAGILSVACACTKKNNTSDITPSNPADDVVSSTVTENVLHDINVDFNSPVGDFVKNGSSAYKIFAQKKYVKAANYIDKHIKAATGCSLSVSTDVNPDLSKGKYIVLGDSATFRSYGVELPERSLLRSAGYYIKTVADDVFIGFYSENGAQLGALAFLRETIGYDMLSDDMVIYEKDGTILPQMDITERPDYEFRLANNKLKDDASYGMGFTTVNTLLTTKPTGAVHNFYDFFTDEEFSAHPEWFSDGAIKASENLGQPCFTAHGNKDDYDALVNFIATKVKGLIETESENVVNMRISQNDVVGNNTVRNCTCKACEASIAHCGTIGGAMLSFTNDLAKIINAYMEENHPDRDFHLVLLVYGSAIQAPAKKDGSKYILDKDGRGIPTTRYFFNENGEGIPVSDENGKEELLVFEKNVGCEFAPSSANWLHTFDEEQNSGYSGALEAWTGLGGDLYIWAYETSYRSYFYPFNNYDIIVENIKYFKRHGGNYMYPQGTWENVNAAGFSKFRTYLDAKALFDVNVNYEELKEKFFDNYFGDAADYMKEFLRLCQLNCEIKEKIIGTNVQTTKLASKEVWSQALLNQLMGLIDESYKAIAKYKGENEKLYDALNNHILIESMFPRLALCSLYADDYSAETLKEMRVSFKKDFIALGNVRLIEGTDATSLFKEWNID